MQHDLNKLSATEDFNRTNHLAKFDVQLMYNETKSLLACVQNLHMK